jgi:hypothetical protein
MVWFPVSKLFDDRISLSRASLEAAITEAVKASPDCESFVGVFVMPVKQESRFDANWSIKGVKFGRTDRDKSSKVLASIVEVMQREFSLSEGGSVTASATQFALGRKGVEDAASGTGENRIARAQGGGPDPIQ